MKKAFIILFAAVLLTGCGSSYTDSEGREYEFDDSNYYNYARDHYDIGDLYDSPEIIEYVRDNYYIEDIYDYDELLEYVVSYDPEIVFEYLSENYEDDLIDYIRQTYYPEDIFPELEEEEEEE